MNNFTVHLDIESDEESREQVLYAVISALQSERALTVTGVRVDKSEG